ncbi:type III-B CRISPR module RAMP protein Cmr6 [Paenibacillus sp. UY79]|nr:type III-B CRISPR module RAMP protein Cmr6 [Paenibacillus farraposensis]
MLETSLTLHRIYGVAYLPGTALKGVASHYAHRQLGDQQPALKRTGSDYNILFGSQTSAGFIQFHDALPTPATVSKALKQDVHTAHHQDYNGIIVEPIVMILSTRLHVMMILPSLFHFFLRRLTLELH